MRLGLALAVAGVLLGAAVRADEPAVPTPPQAQPDDTWKDCQWMIPASGVFARGDAGLDQAADEAFRRTEDIWNEDLRQVVRTSRQGTGLKAAGKLATLIGRAGAYGGIVGAATSGDWAGMGQEGINAFLGDVAAAAGAALAVAVLLPATASVAVITAVGVAGAVVFSTGYDWIVKPVVDAGFDSGVRTSQDRAAAEQRVERARIWAAEAETACGDARRWLAEGRRGVGEEGTAEETARWLGEESAAAEGRIARARELAAQARASAAPAEAAADAAASAAQGEELATDAVGYADEACRVAVEMAGTRQADAQRIWSRSDRYLDERAQTVASRSEGADEKAREAAARAEEIDALRREAAAAAAGALAELGPLEADVAGGRARLEQLAGGVRRARVWLERAAAAAEACDGQRGKAIALLDKPPWNGYPEVQSVLHEVRPIAPPYAEVEALADAISEADAVVASATRRLEEIAAAVAGWRRELGAALPAPDPGAVERARDAAARAGEARGAAARAAARAGRCAGEARAIAEAAPIESEPSAEPSTGGGWERVGGVETVGGAPVPAAPAAPAAVAEVAIEDLLGDAETAHGRCDFAAARAAIAVAQARLPGDPYVLEVAARIEAKAERQMAAIAALQSAEQALARGERKAALAALDRAADAAPDCFTRQVAAVSRGVREGLATQHADADERARAAIGGMLGTLVGVMNAATAAAGGGTGPAAGAGPGVYPGAGGSTGGSAPGGAGTGSSCWVGGASHAAELYLLLRQRPQPNVTNYVIVPTSRKNAAAAASGTGMELVSEHRSYEEALAAARRACPSSASGNR